ncbi:hypothetical protein ACTQ45_05870 [Fundicoccus sp. Sow4_D5]
MLAKTKVKAKAVPMITIKAIYKMTFQSNRSPNTQPSLDAVRQIEP